MRLNRISSPARRRRLRILAAVGWWGVVAWFARETIRTRDAGAEHLMATLVLAYLAGWAPLLALSNWSPVGKLGRFLVCTASILAPFLALEAPAALGILDYREVFHTPTPPWRRSGNVPDPELLYARKPNQRLRLRFQGSDRHALRGAPAAKPIECDTTLDAQGFRNPPGLKTASIVLIGDSFIEGLQVADDALVSSRLAALRGVPVANLGRTGYGPRQEGAVLSRFAARYAPQTCVWFFYEGNDLQDLASYDADRERVQAMRPESFRRAWYGRSFVRNAAGRLLRGSGDAGAVAASSRAGTFQKATGETVDLYFSCGVHEGSAEAIADRAGPKTMDRLQVAFAEAAATCRSMGMDLVVAFVPSKFRVYRDFCRFAPDSPCPTWPVDDLPTAVAEAAREASAAIGFVDLTPSLQEKAKAGELVYLPDDTHWSAEGHRAAAVAIAEYLDDRDRLRNVEARLTSGRSPEPPGGWPTGSTE